MIEYRRIRLSDVGPMTEFALKAMPDEPEVAVSREKVLSMVSFFAIHHDPHFQLAAFVDGHIVAAVAMLVADMPFHERGEGTIVFCYSQRPGAGYRLLRELVRWVNDDMRIRRVSWNMNRGFDERLGHMAKRLGFASQQTMLVMYKG